MRWIVVCSVLVAMSCRPQEENAAPPPSVDSIHQDLPRLGRILRWDSLSPKSVKYRIHVQGTPSRWVPGPTDWTLEAILRYDSSTFAQLEANLRQAPPGDCGLPENFAWGWLDSSDRTALAGESIHGGSAESVFPREACPNGKLGFVSSGILLLRCETR